MKIIYDEYTKDGNSVRENLPECYLIREPESAGDKILKAAGAALIGSLLYEVYVHYIKKNKETE